MKREREKVEGRYWDKGKKSKVKTTDNQKNEIMHINNHYT